MTSRQPRVEFLWWDGCPSWERALALLRAEMESLGLDSTTIEEREIATDDSAEREGFAGSPTIRVAGHDVQAPGDEATGLTCRLYRLRDGRISPLPDPADLRDALVAATAAVDPGEEMVGAGRDAGAARAEGPG